MSVKIRLARHGAKKRPFYRIVATDSESPRDGKFLEILGHYDPIPEPALIHINEIKIDKWKEKGAKLSDTVRSLLRKQVSSQAN